MHHFQGLQEKMKKGTHFTPIALEFSSFWCLSLTFLGTCEMVREVKFSYWSLLSSVPFLIT